MNCILKNIFKMLKTNLKFCASCFVLFENIENLQIYVFNLLKCK